MVAKPHSPTVGPGALAWQASNFAALQQYLGEKKYLLGLLDSLFTVERDLYRPSDISIYEVFLPLTPSFFPIPPFPLTLTFHTTTDTLLTDEAKLQSKLLNPIGGQ